MTEPKTQSAPEVPPPPPPPVRPVRPASPPPELPALPPLPPLEPPPKPPFRAAGGDEPEPDPEPDLPPPPPARERSSWPLAFAGGFVVLAGAIGWLWQQQNTHAAPDLTALLAPLQQQIKALDDRVTQIEQRPAPTAQAPDLSGITSRLSALEERPGGGSLRSLEARIARAEQAAKAAPAPETGVSPRLDADEERLATLERSSTQVSTAAQRVSRLTRIQAAQVALEAGRPIGDLPNAPPELARFATAKPPTEASIHASFPAAARAELAASPAPAQDPNAPAKPFFDRVLERAQGLVTVRTSDHLVVGDQTAVALSHARVALDAGDLENAVSDVASLKGPPAEAIAPWLAQAKALLDARVALATLAANN